MAQEYVAVLLDDACMTIDELAQSCTVSREWVIEHVRAGVLLGDRLCDTEPSRWSFNGRDLLRTRRLSDLERTFDANPELAGLVVDLLDEVECLRKRLLRAGLTLD